MNNIMVEFCPWLCCDVDVSRSGLTEFLQIEPWRGGGNLISTRVPFVSVPNKTAEGVWLNVFFLLSWCNIKGSCFLISLPRLYCWVMTSWKFERWARGCSPSNRPGCLLVKIATWWRHTSSPAQLFLPWADMSWPLHLKAKVAPSLRLLHLLNKIKRPQTAVSLTSHMESPQGLPLSFDCKRGPRPRSC